LGESREALQDAGASLVEQGWDQFCRSVVAQAGWEPGQPLVIDGIRHAEAMDSLRALVAPAVLYLVFVDADRATREARLRERGDVDREQLERIERHSTELQLQTIVPSMANLTVDGTRPVRDLVREIAGWVQNR